MDPRQDSLSSMATETERWNSEAHTQTEGVSPPTTLVHSLQNRRGASHGWKRHMHMASSVPGFHQMGRMGTDPRRDTSPWPRDPGICHLMRPKFRSSPETHNSGWWFRNSEFIRELRQDIPCSCSPLTLLLSSHLGGFSMQLSCQTSDGAAETPLTFFPFSGRPQLLDPKFLVCALQGMLPNTTFHESTKWDQHEHQAQCISISWVHHLPRMTGGKRL